MDRADYENYLALFNSRDYDAVLEHFTDDCEVVFAGYCFKGKQPVRDFYAFFHAHTKETITLQHFLAGEDMVALEAVVRLEGIEDMTPKMLEERGLSRLVGLPSGGSIELPQFIHYHLENGKFKKALCSIFEPPTDFISSFVQR
jgi:hypothetical protein